MTDTTTVVTANVTNEAIDATEFCSVAVWINILILFAIAVYAICKWFEYKGIADRFAKRSKQAEDMYDELYKRTWKFTHNDSE